MYSPCNINLFTRGSYQTRATAGQPLPDIPAVQFQPHLYSICFVCFIQPVSIYSLPVVRYAIMNAKQTVKILAATNNSHKLREFKRLFNPLEIMSPHEYGITFHCEENGHSFYENALLKACACAAHTAGDIPILADDSGICVLALDGAPGIYSARFGNNSSTTPLDDAARTRLLLENMPANITNRSAFYVCAMVLYYSPTHLYLAQEEWHGEIAHTISTTGGGFGYDPIFYVPKMGCCASDLSDSQKDSLSHRGKATRALLKILSSHSS